MKRGPAHLWRIGLTVVLLVGLAGCAATGNDLARGSSDVGFWLGSQRPRLTEDASGPSVSRTGS